MLSPGRHGELACTGFTGTTEFTFVLNSSYKWETGCLWKPTSFLRVKSEEYMKKREFTLNLNDCNSFFIMFISFMRLVSAKLD